MLFFLLLFSIGAHGTPVDLHHVKYVKHQSEHSSLTSFSAKSGTPSIIDLLLNQNSAARVTTQNYRVAHAIKFAVLSDKNFLISLYSAKYSSCGGAISFFRLRRQILFPFHSFW